MYYVYQDVLCIMNPVACVGWGYGHHNVLDIIMYYVYQDVICTMNPVARVGGGMVIITGWIS